MSQAESIPRRQRGVAIITALVVVAVATVAISGMLWRQSVAVRKLENQNAIDEARWLGRSALEWSRVILMQDARISVVDHYGELWAVPLAETRVSNTVQGTVQGASGDDEADAFVGGRISDAQARFNLANLTKNDKVDRPAFETLERLLAVLGQPGEKAKLFAGRMLQTPRPLGYDAIAAELVRGGKLDRAAADALRPYVVVLPQATPVNLNTASPEVIAASFEDLSLDQARALALSRDQIYFNQVSDIFNRLATVTRSTTRSQAGANVAVATHYFEVSGEVRNGRAEYLLSALIERDNGGLARIVSISEP